ncbi:PREDICTED: uncharacterized protein LOC106810188 [Priapulus caudatus]|uniref:Uncharacterized protein LOC106810188 n=1 Tax=Priapulus caudatus TaxID=37621 RepID=A0ABM1E9T3_PRICU|nr:PREDICTED: uncharacterized protein LOC106810188 [Priapulus caudatus]
MKKKKKKKKKKRKKEERNIDMLGRFRSDCDIRYAEFRHTRNTRDSPTRKDRQEAADAGQRQYSEISAEKTTNDQGESSRRCYFATFTISVPKLQLLTGINPCQRLPTTTNGTPHRRTPPSESPPGHRSACRGQASASCEGSPGDRVSGPCWARAHHLPVPVR